MQVRPVRGPCLGDHARPGRPARHSRARRPDPGRHPLPASEPRGARAAHPLRSGARPPGPQRDRPPLRARSNGRSRAGTSASPASKSTTAASSRSVSQLAHARRNHRERRQRVRDACRRASRPPSAASTRRSSASREHPPALQREDEVQRERSNSAFEAIRRVETEIEAMRSETNRISRTRRPPRTGAGRTHPPQRAPQRPDARKWARSKAHLNEQDERTALVEARMAGYQQELSGLKERLRDDRRPDQPLPHRPQ